MSKRLRGVFISIFVTLFILAFHYESIRYFYLNPLFGKDLPKIKFLFPPAGWIMFYNVDDSAGFAEVYGVKNGYPQRIDPHDIIETRPIGYDNIRRNILSVVLSSEYKKQFCAFLERKFPGFDNFVITQVYYPSLTKIPRERMERVVYKCR